MFSMRRAGKFATYCLLGLSIVLNAIWLSSFLARKAIGDALFITKEVSRVPSPDNKVDAVIIYVNASATVEDTLEVFVVPSGQQVT